MRVSIATPVHGLINFRPFAPCLTIGGSGPGIDPAILIEGVYHAKIKNGSGRNFRFKV
jgi:hypothetical protein